jgi:hypothetical protein
LIEDELTIYSSKENGNVLLFNEIGQVVRSSGLQQEITMNLAGLTSGIYILQIQSGKSSKVFRIFKK